MITGLGVKERLEQTSTYLPENASPMSEKFNNVLSTVDAEFAKAESPYYDEAEKQQAALIDTGVKTTAFLAENSEIMRNSKVMYGVTWTDETLAGNVGGIEAKIDMSKSFDWNATGEHTLTADELAELREKYNPENLSRQNFYDLMCDLSKLNAITAEDVHGMFLKKAAPMGMYPSNAIEWGRGPSFVEGNIFGALESEIGSISSMTEFMLSKDFWKMNPSADKTEHSAYIDYLNSRADSMTRLIELLSAIKE
jgi:hypothetical protein